MEWPNEQLDVSGIADWRQSVIDGETYVAFSGWRWDLCCFLWL